MAATGNPLDFVSLLSYSGQLGNTASKLKSVSFYSAIGTLTAISTGSSWPCAACATPFSLLVGPQIFSPMHTGRTSYHHTIPSVLTPWSGCFVVLVKLWPMWPCPTICSCMRSHFCPHTHQAHLAHRSCCTNPWNCRSLILPHLPQSFPALHLLLAGHTHQRKQQPPWGPRLAFVQFGALACLLFCWWPISLCAPPPVFCMEAPNARELECSSLPHLLP
mmetsp:Transcript_97833/g.164792  ORF Transcript_97833/g.164792 Transcript_97833/m.164792 type:complete len:219 (+) Transcript_97833:901-1557(+)